MEYHGRDIGFLMARPEHNKFFEDVPTPDPALQELLRKEKAEPITFVDGEPRSYITEAGEVLQAKPGQVLSCDDPKKIRSVNTPEVRAGVRGHQMIGVTGEAPQVRIFTSGATRDTDNNKFDYEAFFCPLVLERRAEYMHKHRIQPDGSLRAGDNWQKGIPLEAYAKSEARHHHQFWKLHRGLPTLDEKGNPVDLEEAICALMFNLEGYLHELLKNK